ncbi:hypothetical protein DL766_002177 [Monosporascus sp. MC13-8B]|uniref:Heterokaryon incompatibility domain-containing protein n=1 Tax=Monosporascus cannonballus TaxID=155416 RepID=A0ABY0H0I1_9PEZI|nr:hypothetical protein DL762_007121 [Monosporascus cannonballus]RYO88352.1 hypothetical protein DL763_006049 [Monosporascus cannonballus]RYP36128.1 hypothetical protein DL766_002177 [Monosporascus sp. MC13-8B]
MDSQMYRYAPLGEEPDCDAFRILTVLPGVGDQPLECTLEHVALDDSPSYEALSYVRNRIEETEDIICSGKLLAVETHLYSALSHLRLPSQPRNLWVGAICVNQRDNDERGRQVRLMQKIYPEAKQLLIWLGEADSGSDQGIDVAHEIARVCRASVAPGRPLGTLSLSDALVFGDFSRFCTSSGIGRLSELAKIRRYGWFEELWAIQELALARGATMLCGSASVSWSDFIAAVTVQDYVGLPSGNREQKPHLSVLQKARDEWLSGPQLGLLTVLFRYRIFDTADPRDKIFGLSNLFQERFTNAQALQVNYDLGTTELYRGVAKAILQESSNLNILSVPRRFGGIGPSSLPSWVPDWTNTRLTVPLGRTNYSDIDDIAFAASRASKPRIRLDEPTSSLVVEAHLLDRISAIGWILREDRLPRLDLPQPNIPDCCYVLDDWARVAGLEQGSPYITGEPILDAFVHTLVAESASESIETLRAQLAILEKYVPIARFVASAPRGTPAQLELVRRAVSAMHAALFDGRAGELTGEFRSRLAALADRRVFRTARGYIGLAPALAGAGDEVVLVRGAKVPLVLRPRGEARTLQGDCYVRGVMRGEAYNERDCIPIWIR